MPAASQPLVSQFNDYRAGAQPDGWLTVVPPQPRGLLAYLSDHDIFNTAVFSAAPVLSTVSAVLVNSWGDGSSRYPFSTVVTPDSCSVEASAAAALAAAAPAPPGQPSWGVAARSSHTAGVKGAKVTVVYQSFTTEVRMLPTRAHAVMRFIARAAPHALFSFDFTHRLLSLWPQAAPMQLTPVQATQLMS
jgi:hypothetical protein